MSQTATSLGAEFAEAVAGTNRTWEASDPETVIEDILKSWIEADENVEELLAVETDTVADRERVGRIGWLRLVCSGSRPL